MDEQILDSTTATEGMKVTAYLGSLTGGAHRIVSGTVTAADPEQKTYTAKLRTMREIDIDAEIEDIMITLSNQYHQIRALNSRDTSGLFVCLVLDRTSANLALACHKLNAVSGRITI